MDRRTASILFTIIAFGASIFVLYEARRPIAIVIFSIFFAYLLEPIVTWFASKLHGSRGGGIAVTYLLLGVCVIGFVIISGPRIVGQGKALVREFPQLVEKVGSGDIAQNIGERQGWSYETELEVQRFLLQHRANLDLLAHFAEQQMLGFTQVLLWLFLIPILAIFFLKDRAEFSKTLTSFMDSRHDRQFVRGIIGDLDVMLTSFIRAQLTISLLSMVAYTSFLVSSKFPFAFPIAVVAGSLEFVPVVGPICSAVLIIGIAIITNYKHLFMLIGFLLVWRIIQDYLNSPLLMQRRLKLHPFVVVVGVLICGEVGGVPGVFLSVPILATLRIVWKNWNERAKAIEARPLPKPGHDREAISLAITQKIL